MNTDIAQLCRVLRSLLAAAQKGKISKGDYSLCEALLSTLEEKYRAGVASLELSTALDKTINQTEA